MAVPALEEVGRLRAWQPAPPDGVWLDLGVAVAHVAVARDGTVRVRAAAGRELPPDPGSAIGRAPWPAAAVEPAERPDGGVGLAFEGPEGAVRVEITAEPAAVRVLDREGRPLAELGELAFAPDGAARASLSVQPEDGFFGFGEKSGPFDQRGRRLRFRNRDANLRVDRDPLYASIPFFLQRTGGGARVRFVGVLLDVFAPTWIDVAAADPERVALESDAGGLDVAVFPGPTPAEVLRRYTARTGRAPRPPRWGLGYHQSRWSYASEGAVRRVAGELRRRRIPADAIHLDIDYMDGFRVFTWDRRRFPDPERLAADLRAMGMRVVVLVDPGVKHDPDWEVFRGGLERDVFCRRADGSLFTLKVWPGDAALPDFDRPDVREWWGEQHRRFVELGVAGWVNDMNEPAGWRRELRIGRKVIPLQGQDLSDVVQADPAAPERKVPHEHVRNLYGHLECRGTREGLRRLAPDRRPFVITRSGFAGVQQWAGLWTGDNLSTWEQLRLSVRMLLGLSVSGVPLCGADIGGFALPCTPELFARWMQIGALYPFARNHSMWGKPRQEPWRFGRRVEAISRAALELRMRLLPYLYGLFCEAEATGAPVWRPLFWEFPDDPECAAVDDQVMLGPSLLLAPVLRRGARMRDVVLPPGVWFDLHDDARYVGPRRIRVAAPLERMPLFARGGSVIPTQSAVQHTGETPSEPLVLRIFPGADGRAVIVEDDGESPAYADGAEARTALRLFDRAGGRLRLELGARRGDHPVPARTARAVVHGCPPPTHVVLDAAPVPEGDEAPGWRWRQGRLHVRFLDDGAARVLEVEPAP